MQDTPNIRSLSNCGGPSFYGLEGQSTISTIHVDYVHAYVCFVMQLVQLVGHIIESSNPIV